MNLIKLHRVGAKLHQGNIPLLPKIIRYLIFLIYNSDVPCSVKIGKGTVFGHTGIGVVIHPKAVIGKNCIIGQGITIGGRSRAAEVPVIGDKVYIGAGARVLGPIKIGNNCIIGPNAVVIKDVADNTIVGGIPAKVLRENIKFEDYV